MEDYVELIVGVALIVAAVLLSFALAFVSAHYEAKSYNRITGSSVTTWDALWVDLRVVESVK